MNQTDFACFGMVVWNLISSKRHSRLGYRDNLLYEKTVGFEIDCMVGFAGFVGFVGSNRIGCSFLYCRS